MTKFLYGQNFLPMYEVYRGVRLPIPRVVYVTVARPLTVFMLMEV
jgi:hypothetical protein